MERDLVGMRFGRWLVDSKAPDYIAPDGRHRDRWYCVCDCGNIKAVRGSTLVNGQSQSCGCLQKEQLSGRASKHKGYGTRLYPIWNSMRQRCNNPKSRPYKNYGGRGIKICPEWDDYAVFREWAKSTGYDEDAERGYLTLDRIDVDGDYCPENCRWVNMREQANNRRDTLLMDYQGETHPLSMWAEILNIPYQALYHKTPDGAKVYKQG